MSLRPAQANRWWLVFFGTLGVFVVMLCYFLSRNQPVVRVTLGTKTNEFGFPIGSLVISNELPVSVAFQWDIEMLRGDWTKVADNHAACLGPHGVLRNDLSHPIPEGLWRVRVRWMRVPTGRVYRLIEKFRPGLLFRLDQESPTYSEPIEAWQPFEVRGK